MESRFVARLERQSVTKRNVNGTALETSREAATIYLTAESRAAAWDELAGKIRDETYADTGRPNLVAVSIFDVSGNAR
jgi:hypothetical protein